MMALKEEKLFYSKNLNAIDEKWEKNRNRNAHCTIVHY
jgi:hypothetical protein